VSIRCPQGKLYAFSLRDGYGRSEIRKVLNLIHMVKFFNPVTTYPSIKSILIAEDDPNDLIIFERAIRGFIGELIIVRNGEDAIRKLKTRLRSPLDILFLDLKMPKRSGLEVLEWLVKNPKHRPKIVCILSSSDSPADINKAKAIGADSYFQKDARLSDVRDLVFGKITYLTSSENSFGSDLAENSRVLQVLLCIDQHDCER
jgi:CheY-like chemotaxis protein